MSTQNFEEKNRDIDAKTVLLCASLVGKTSIVIRATENTFNPKISPTVGGSYNLKEVEIEDTHIHLQIWDTAGQERFRTLAPLYYRSAVVALLVFALNNRSSLEDVQTWADEIKDQNGEIPILFVIGNKLDLDRVIPPTEGQKVAESIGAIYLEVSAKTGFGVDGLFLRVAEEVAKKYKNKQLELESQEIEKPQDSKKGCFC